ncbi:hypothetical protein ABFX02_06G131000 [Erythranthe guttata]
MSLIPSFFGNGRRNPFQGFPLSIAGVDWKETPEAHLFKVDVPGLKKEEVKVEELRKVHPLPENAKLEDVTAAMENGVLTVTVPKEEVKKPEVKAIG